MIEQVSELVFTIPAIVGLMVCWWMFNASQADLRELYRRKLNGAREIVGKASRRNELIRTLIQADFLIIGVSAMLDVPSPAIGIIVSGGIIAAQLMLVSQAILDRRDRHRVIDVLTQREGE